ncbi:MAG: hypothetical protein M0P71_04560 [Melioribacteraceae bacterium]|nr:hypothetical protein [Melioribacteraceae bacterium]
MKNLFKFLLLVIISATIFSCSEDENTVTQIEEKNSVAVNIGSNSYSVAATVKDYDDFNDSPVIFNKSNITASISVVDMKGGKVTLIVKGDNDVVLYTKVISNQISAIKETFSGIPKNISFRLENFTGTLAINVKGE